MSSLRTLQMDQKVTTQTALSNKNYVIVGDFNAHAPFGENGCTSVTCNRLVENIVDSSLCMLNDGRITRIPDVSTHKSTAIDLSLVSPDLAVNCTRYTEEDCLGSDHLPIIIDLYENIKDDEPEDDEKFLNFNISMLIGKHIRHFFYLLTLILL